MNCKKNWQQVYDKIDPSQVISDIAASSSGNLVVMEQGFSGSKLKLFSPDGSFIQMKEIFNPVKPEAVIPDNNGAMMVFSNGNLEVIRYTQLNAM